MDRYSRMVQFLKVLLPLAAILLLSMVFLLSRSIETQVAVPFSQQDIDDRLNNQLVTQPNYRGVTRNGEDIQVEAVRASRGTADEAPTAAEFKGRLGLNGGRVITLDSNTGLIRPDKGMATFSDDVVVTTTDGFRVTTDLLNTSLDEIRGDTPGQVAGTGPIGNFTAGRMTFGAENSDGPVHIVFTDGVKLIYEPKKTER
ncbi:lipopolysaccharide export system protein LptC [Ruegeria intermedia]|uniref:Lipopolysaccharide export system protein LptC n=1 Tax=Ruegeria intermedia TaxID=996115 RepID=A0A1M4XNW5_9RHOB|nr:LPS export ABC transporter periplasmic protein LptC [Ruegeria intermedia]SHE95287.1 lipopolysaccharide export system protein LptC [Ruegeria intermedia]